MIYLGVELYSVNFTVQNMVAGHLNVSGARDHFKNIRISFYGIAVRHPHLTTRSHSFYQLIFTVYKRQIGPAVFPDFCRNYFAAPEFYKVLCSVANTKYRDFVTQRTQIREGCVRIVGGGRAARKDNTFKALVYIRDFCTGMYLAVNIELAYSAGYQLGVLRPEINNQYSLFHCAKIKRSGFDL